MKVIVCALFIVFVTLAARTQESSRKWDISVWLAGATGEELTNSFGEAQLWSAGLSVSRVLTPDAGRGWCRGRLEYGFNLTPLLIQTRPQLIYGGGFEPVILRWNSAVQIRTAHPYVELAGGALRTTASLPLGNTSSFNFTVHGGGGLQIPLGGDHHMEIGLRWSHISNADLGVRNPEFNGVEVRVGYHWKK